MGTAGRRQELRSVPGYELLERQHLTRREDRCLARETGGGDLVELRLLSVDDARPEELSVVAEELAAAQSPFLLSIRRLLEVDGAVVLVVEAPPRTSLADLVAARPLGGGEVSAVAAGLASALSALHQVGQRHGAVSPQTVRLTRAGRPMLALAGAPLWGGDLPEPPYRDPWGTGSDSGDDSHVPASAADVYGMAAVCLMALAGSVAAVLPRRQDLPASVPAPMVEQLTAVLAAEPASRPTPEELAAALAAIAPPETVRVGPVAVPPPRPPVARSQPRRRSRRTRAPSPRAVVSVLCTVLVVAVAGAAYGLRGAAPPTPAATPGHTPATPVGTVAPSVGTVSPAPPPPAPPAVQEPQWSAVLTQLDARRAAAFATGDFQVLEEVYTADSPAGGRDVAALEEVLTHGLRARGMRSTLVDVSLASRTGDTAVLDVVDRLAAVDFVNDAGTVRRRQPPRGEASWRVTVRHGSGQWRIHDVVRR